MFKMRAVKANIPINIKDILKLHKKISTKAYKEYIRKEELQTKEMSLNIFANESIFKNKDTRTDVFENLIKKNIFALRRILICFHRFTI